MTDVHDQPSSVLPAGRRSVTRVERPGGGVAVRKQWLGHDPAAWLGREAAILQRLSGVPGVPVLAEPFEGTCLYLVDAGEVPIPADRPRTTPEVLDIAVSMARTLAAIHARGVIHKNIWPGTVMLGADGVPVLVDFDLATMFAEERPGFTHPNELDGALGYLAPEQTGRTGRPVDQRTDLYALGATLYHLATGRPPFAGTDPLQLIHDQLTCSPVAPTDVNPLLRTDLSQLILRMMEKEPDRRYQSADGLRHDVERMRSEPGPIVLGERDFPSRLAAPSPLIGRDAELAAMRSAFAGAARGLLVAGRAGVGKTALLDELRPMAAEADGWFVVGKFDQYRRDRDSDAVRQVLRALARLLLAEPDHVLNALRGRLRERVGVNVALIVADLPEFALIIGTDGGAGPADDPESGSRLLQGYLGLLRAIADLARPLIMVIDDLQWAPAFAIRMIDAIMSDPDLSGVLVVGSYRDDEVGAAHPLAAAQQRWREAALIPVPLMLRDLPETDLAQFLTTMMRLPRDRAGALADAIRPRTAGNPYDTVELINALRRDGVITLGPNGWQWDEVAIRGWVGSDDVLDLVMARIRLLPPAAAELLTVAACLGGEINLDLLSVVTGRPAVELTAQAAPALADGLLIRERGAIRFRHDRALQAAYSSQDPDSRIHLHRRLGLALAAHDRYRGLAAEQFLHAASILVEPGDCALAIDLFGWAAATVRLVNPVRAQRFLSTALDLVDRGPASADPALRVRLQADLHTTLFLLGRLDEADAVFAELAESGDEPFDLIDVVCTQILSLTSRRRIDDALRLGEQTLSRIGISRPIDLDDTLPQRVSAVADWAAGLNEHPDRRPDTTDPRHVAAARLLDSMLSPAFFGGTAAVAWIVLESHRRWMQTGPCPALVPALSRVIRTTVLLLEDYRTAYAAGRNLIALAEQRGYGFPTVMARAGLVSFVQVFFEPLEDHLAAVRRVREEMLQAGDVHYACLVYQMELTALLDSSPSLSSLGDCADAGVALAERTGNRLATTMLLPFRYFVREMAGESTGADGFLDRAEHVPAGRANFHALNALAALLHDDDDALAHHADAASELLTAMPGTLMSMTIHLVHLFGLRPKLDDPARREQFIAEHAWIRQRAIDNPGSFGHLAELVEAERLWADGDGPGAMRHYDIALRLVRGRQRPWHEALINLRAGRAHVASGLEVTGRALLGRARVLLSNWGAAGPAQRLPEPADSESGRPVRSVSSAIDLIAVLEASQLISSETNVHRLRDRVTNVVGAMTGATSVRLLMHDQARNSWLADTADGDVPITEPTVAATLPLAAVRFADRTSRTLLVSDAVEDGRFNRDPHIAGMNVCSLLIAPVAAHGQTVGMLVLENTLTRDAFTHERLDAVGLIVGQLAVSLDNALLYQSMERKVAERTMELEEANHRLEKLSVTDQLTGCANRRQFDDRLTLMWHQAVRDRRPLAVVMIDIDHFKLFNDHYGHVRGDECIRQVARTIRTNVRVTDVAARYGGEEFALILPNSDLREALAAARKIRAAVEELAEPHRQSRSRVVTISVGAASLAPVEGGDPAKLVEAADSHLYEAKRVGRNRVAPDPAEVG